MGGRKSVKELRKLLNGNKWSKNKTKITKITYYLQYLGSKFKSSKAQKHVFRFSQCSPLPTGWDSWIQVSGLHKQMECINAH